MNVGPARSSCLPDTSCLGGDGLLLALETAAFSCIFDLVSSSLRWSTQSTRFADTGGYRIGR